MILSGLINIVTFLLNLIPLNLPSFGNGFTDSLGILKGYLDNSISFIYAYMISYDVVKTIFSLIVMWISAKFLYWMFFWVLKKLPIGVDA